MQTPFLPGDAPSFELDRNGLPVASGTGTDVIQAAPKYNDYHYPTGDLIGPAINAAPKAPSNLTAHAGDGSLAAAIWEDKDTTSLAPGASITLTAAGAQTVRTTGRHPLARTRSPHGSMT